MGSASRFPRLGHNSQTALADGMSNATSLEPRPSQSCYNVGQVAPSLVNEVGTRSQWWRLKSGDPPPALLVTDLPCLDLSSAWASPLETSNPDGSNATDWADWTSTRPNTLGCRARSTPYAAPSVCQESLPWQARSDPDLHVELASGPEPFRGDVRGILWRSGPNSDGPVGYTATRLHRHTGTGESWRGWPF